MDDSVIIGAPPAPTASSFLTEHLARRIKILRFDALILEVWRYAIWHGMGCNIAHKVYMVMYYYTSAFILWLISIPVIVL